jgi:hypothetical protein
MTTKIDKVSSLEVEVESLQDEIRYLKADQRAKDHELDTARQELQILRQNPTGRSSRPDWSGSPDALSGVISPLHGPASKRRWE